MPKRKTSKTSRKRTKLSVDLKVLQLIIVAVIFAFAFTVLSFITQVMAPNENKTAVYLPDIVLTRANLLINTAGWKTYSANGIKLKYPDKWILVENAANFSAKLGTHTFFSPKKDSSQGLALFIVPKTLPGEWISKGYAPGFLRQAESVSLIKIGGRNATRVVNLPSAWKNEIVFITNNNTTYVLYIRGGDQEIRIFETLLKTVKLL